MLTTWVQVRAVPHAHKLLLLGKWPQQICDAIVHQGGQIWNKEWRNGGPTERAGKGLYKDIVNINENYINYIQSNPKLVQTVDDLAVVDTGTAGHYLTLDLPCNNKQQAVHPLPIQIPNGEIITSIHTVLLSHQELSI